MDKARKEHTKKIGANIAKYRKLSATERVKMATDLGIRRQSLYDIERGKQGSPSAYMIARIAEYLGITVNKLFE